MEKNLEINSQLPLYHTEIYGWLYSDPMMSGKFGRYWFRHIAMLGNDEVLVDSMLKDIVQGERVLQMGLTFGHEIESLAARIGENGQFDILDINPTQLQLAKEKYQDIPFLNSINHDVTKPFPDNGYDTVICFMLLHELPLPSKVKAINNALAAVRKGGKVIFVDYHNPSYWHPLRYFIRMFNRLYQPFAEKVWDNEISGMADNVTDFTWRKSTFSGRMYQKVVATRKDDPLKLILGSEPQSF